MNMPWEYWMIDNFKLLTTYQSVTALFMADFLQDEVHEGCYSSKLDVQSPKSTTRSRMIKDKCKMKDLKVVFRSFL